MRLLNGILFAALTVAAIPSYAVTFDDFRWLMGNWGSSAEQGGYSATLKVMRRTPQAGQISITVRDRAAVICIYELDFEVDAQGKLSADLKFAGKTGVNAVRENPLGGPFAPVKTLEGVANLVTEDVEDVEFLDEHGRVVFTGVGLRLINKSAQDALDVYPREILFIHTPAMGTLDLHIKWSSSGNRYFSPFSFRP